MTCCFVVESINTFIIIIIIITVVISIELETIGAFTDNKMNLYWSKIVMELNDNKINVVVIVVDMYLNF